MLAFTGVVALIEREIKRRRAKRPLEDVLAHS